ncbi:MAG: hypothetical protein AB7H88_11315 [Vicinamibacterales bacterium]
MASSPGPGGAAVRGRRIVGIALLLSAALLLLAAWLVFAAVIPVGEGARPIVAAAMGAAALIDVLVGIRFLVTASTP